MPRPLRKLSLVVAAASALQRPATHSLARRRGTPLLGTLVSFNSLAADYNRPFRGAFKIESETVTASLRQLRETLSPYCDVNGCVVPEAADESGGFGGIIAPPWWDDFQEP